MESTEGRDSSRDYPSSMTDIIDEHYGGYVAGNPLNCDKNTILPSTNGNTEVMYNYSYYRNDGEKGVIGSNGNLECNYIALWCPTSNGWLVVPKEGTPTSLWKCGYDYGSNNPLEGDSWAYNLADFIDKVLVATGASQVDIVTHSMGGLVTRSAIKYYGCNNKVRKLITIGTPNHYFNNTIIEELGGSFVTNDPEWMRNGEDWEMSFDNKIKNNNITFRDTSTGISKPFTEFLNANSTEDIVTISGNRGYPIFTPNDKIVTVDQVHLDNAEFNAVVYEQHTYDNDIPELCETSSSFTTEFIKKWMIDDEVKMTNIATNFAYDASETCNPYHWAKGCLRIRSAALNYNNSLITLVRLQKKVFKKDKGDTTKTLYDVYTKAFPIYKYSRSFPGDPVFLVNKIHWELCSEYWLTIWDMDMTGQIKYSRETIHLENGDSAYVTLLHINGCYIGYSTSFTWETNDYAVYQKLYYKKDNGSWTFLATLNGSARSYTFTPSSIGSYNIRIGFYLDAFTPIWDTSNTFQVSNEPNPYDVNLTGEFQLGNSPYTANSGVQLLYNPINGKGKDEPHPDTNYYYDIYKDGNRIEYHYDYRSYFDSGYFSSFVSHTYKVKCWYRYSGNYFGQSRDITVWGKDSTGCPYFYIKENGEYIPQNTIMHYGYSNNKDNYLFNLGNRYKEELRKNRITDDRYKDEKSVIESAISENEVEKDYIDRVNLKAVKYDSTYNLTLNTKGEYLFWKDIYKIDSCKNAKGEDILPLVENLGDIFYIASPGDTIYIYTSTRCCDKANASEKSNRGGSIIIGPGVKPKDKGKGKNIEPSIEIEYTGGKSWVNCGEIYPREYIYANYNDIPLLSDSIRFVINNEVKIDYISFPKAENVKYSEINLELINPTLKGKNVMKQIIKEDSVYINLTNGDTLYFSFPPITSVNGEKVSYILETDGYYNINNKRDKSESVTIPKSDIKFISGIVYLQSKCKIFSNYEIYNISGRQVEQGEIKTSKIKLQKLCNGIYFIKLKGKHKSETHKFEIIR